MFKDLEGYETVVLSPKQVPSFTVKRGYSWSSPVTGARQEDGAITLPLTYADRRSPTWPEASMQLAADVKSVADQFRLRHYGFKGLSLKLFFRPISYEFGDIHKAWCKYAFLAVWRDAIAEERNSEWLGTMLRHFG